MTKLLILTPIKDAARHLDRYFGNLLRLDRAGLRLALGMLEGDSVDDSYALARRGMTQLSATFESARLWRKSFGYRMPDGVPRWAEAHQLARRAVLARARNHLLFHALEDADWVLWLDVDVIDYPADLLQRLLAAGESIVHPHCVRRYGGPTFDRNAWAGQAATCMEDMRGGPELTPLDAVGGTCLLVSADLHRDGLIFPPFPYGRPHPSARRPGPWAPLAPGEIETEGLGLMAQDMGVQCWGMPGLEILHSEH